MLVEETFKDLLASVPDFEYSFFIEKYSESHRYYHTLEHIKDCLQKLKEVETLCKDLSSLKLALLYHDLFYDPKRKDNELKSAEYIFQLMKKFEVENTEKVRDLILLTKHPSSPKSSDEKLLLDIDLSILGAKPEKYEVYESDIRKEYIHVPKIIYKLGRSKLLKKFLKLPRVYHSEYFYLKYETQARSNLNSALQHL